MSGTSSRNPPPPNGYYCILPKSWITDGFWASLKPVEKAVVVPLHRHFGCKPECWPSITTLCRASGVAARQAVIDALRGLSWRGVIEIEGRPNPRGGRPINVYRRKWLPGETRKFDLEGMMPIHNSLIDSELWGSLSLAAQALYVALRAVAKLYATEENDKDGVGLSGWVDEDMLHDHIRDRTWDVIRKTRKENSASALAKLAGISRRSFCPALDELRMAGLVEDFPPVPGGLRVWLVPE